MEVRGITNEEAYDLVRSPGWRFECGYAFAPDGAVVGIGTFRGNAAAFAIEGL